MSAVSSPENRSENTFFVFTIFRLDKQLENRIASDKHSNLTGIIVEIIVVVISSFIICEMEARIKEKVRIHSASQQGILFTGSNR